MIQKVLFILYVADQQRSVAFYRQVLGIAPQLDEPGMTEFALGENVVLGIMPLTGVARLLRLPANELPAERSLTAEVYLQVDDPAAYHARALAAGAVELSPLAARDWGHLACYSRDPDGTVIAFARPLLL